MNSGAITFMPRYAAVPCPDEITLVVINDTECGYLTVLEDRTKPAGRTIRLFVAKVDPPGGTDRPDEGGPGPGGDIAAPREFGGAAPGAQRTHRNLYLMDERGVGLSEPNLDCPEVHAAAPVLVGFRLRDPAHRATLLAAVGACHDRLVAAGVDLAAYDIAAIAQDHEDLRIALGLPVMNVGSNHGWISHRAGVRQPFPGHRPVDDDGLASPPPAGPVHDGAGGTRPCDQSVRPLLREPTGLCSPCSGS